MNNAAGRIRRILKPIDQNVLVFDPPETNPMTKFQKSLTPGAKRVKDIRYAFDRIFGENSLQEEVSYTPLQTIEYICVCIICLQLTFEIDLRRNYGKSRRQCL